MSEFATVNCLTHSDKCCIHTSICQVVGGITVSRIVSIYCMTGLLGYISYVAWFSADSLYVKYQTCCIVIIKKVYVFKWHNCQLFWNIFEMACFVQVKVDIIGVNCIRRGEMQNDNQMKTIANLGMPAISTFFAVRNWIIMCLYFFDTENLLGVGRLWNM